MSHLLHNHPGLAAIFVLVALAFFVAVVLALAFGWARQRAERVEHAQRSVDAIRWPGGLAPRRTARSEMRSAPR